MVENKVKLYTLIKLISYVKFESKEFESKEFAASPIVGEILSDLLLQFNSSVGKEFSFMIEPENRFEKSLINSIKRHLGHTSEWDEMNIENKKEYIIDLASPYIIGEEKIEFLINFKNTESDNFG
ncbi:hypothetical protein [Flavobacterium mesophilum]|uniref:hypothetical protein n=1 Tax=Flavobacterium mesophilum TaxID=3143495 RepID=UPI0031DD9115